MTQRDASGPWQHSTAKPKGSARYSGANTQPLSFPGTANESCRSRATRATEEKAFARRPAFCNLRGSAALPSEPKRLMAALRRSPRASSPQSASPRPRVQVRNRRGLRGISPTKFRLRAGSGSRPRPPRHRTGPRRATGPPRARAPRRRAPHSPQMKSPRRG